MALHEHNALREPWPTRRSHGPGLRITLLLGLVAVLAVVFASLWAMMLGLEGLSRQRDARQLETLMGHSLQTLLPPSGPARERALRSLQDHDAIAGLRLTDGTPTLELGVRRGRPAVTRRLQTGLLEVWTDHPAPRREISGHLSGGMVLTAVLTLLLSYMALTRLIVRPIDAVTHAAESLSQGQWESRAPIKGAAEISRLALAFNHMASTLRDQNETLARRLDELERTQTELKHSQQKLVQSARLATVGELSAGLAHEIGNPLAAMTGLLQLLIDEASAQSQQREFLERIQHETRRIHRIIRDLLGIARSAEGASPEPAYCQVQESIEQTLQLLAHEPRMQGIEINLQIDEETPPARCATAQVGQLLMNMLLNAADAQSGEGSVTVTLRTIAQQIELSVRDDGPGIEPALLGRLFDPFVTSKPAGQGSGLGLAVCQAITASAEGQIVAENIPSGGALFRVTLPMA